MGFTNFLKFAFPIITVLSLLACNNTDKDQPAAQLSEEALRQKARELAQKFIITDGHIDLPYRLQEYMEDISRKTIGDCDFPKAIAGGLNAPFMSIYVPAKYQEEGGAKVFAGPSLS